MLFAKGRIVALVLVAAMLLSIGGTVSAQTGGYVKTFALPTKPTTDGAYAGVDPTGATITWWHPHQGARLKAVTDAVTAFNNGNPWKIKVNPVYKGDYPVVFQAMLAALQTKDLPNL